MFSSIIKRLPAPRPVRLAKKTILFGTIAVVAASAVLAAPVEKATAGTSFDHGVTVACGYRQFNVTVSASGWYNGQTVATRILVRWPGGAWQDATGWRYDVINPITYINIGTGSTAKSYASQNMRTTALYTSNGGGGYREVAVDFAWYDGRDWPVTDRFYVQRYNDEAWGFSDTYGMNFCLT
jgi:hypothetical protein